MLKGLSDLPEEEEKRKKEEESESQDPTRETDAASEEDFQLRLNRRVIRLVLFKNGYHLDNEPFRDYK